MTPPPSLGNIRDDDELLDALGGRRAPKDSDEVGRMLQAWVSEIDADETAPSRLRPRLRHLASAAGIAITALSVSSMATAVTGYQVPVLYQLGAAAGSVLGSPLHAADSGGHDARRDVAGGTTSTRTSTREAPAPTTSAAGTSPTDLPSARSTETQQHTQHRTRQQPAQPVQPAPSATPEAPSSGGSSKPSTPDDDTRSSEPSSSTSSSDDSSTSTSTSTRTSESSSPTESESSSDTTTSNVSPSTPSATPTRPERTRPTLPSSSQSTPLTGSTTSGESSSGQ